VPDRGPGVQKTPGAGEKKRLWAPAQVVLAASQRLAQGKAMVVLHAPPVLPGFSVAVLQAASGM
jgi:hypothetical protein